MSVARKTKTKKTTKKKTPVRGLHTTRFPGEKPAYRAARDTLLKEEVRLRRQIEAVAEMRRKLPLGGALKEDYVFETGGGAAVHFSELFADGKDTLLVYSFMFGPEMKSACSSCTSMLDGLEGQAPHVTQRANLVVVAKSPIERIKEFASGRGWRNLRLLSSSGSTYNRDYHGETEDGAQIPTMNVFVRRKGKIYHTWSSELMFLPSDAGQNARHIDMIWPLWNVLDYTPEGRGANWYPQLRYE
jgi:predicted dithiol-disulfide oxidoreductase (DUF899 family)